MNEGAEVAVVVETFFAGETPEPAITLLIEERPEVKALPPAPAGVEGVEQGAGANPETVAETATVAPAEQVETGREVNALAAAPEAVEVAQVIGLPAEAAPQMEPVVDQAGVRQGVETAGEGSAPLDAAVSGDAVEAASAATVELMVAGQEAEGASCAAEVAEQAAGEATKPGVEPAAPQVESAAEEIAVIPEPVAVEGVETGIEAPAAQIEAETGLGKQPTASEVAEIAEAIERAGVEAVEAGVEQLVETATEVTAVTAAPIESAAQEEVLQPAAQAEPTPELNALAAAPPEAPAAEAGIAETAECVMEAPAAQVEAAAVTEETAGSAYAMVAESVEPAMEMPTEQVCAAVESAASEEASAFVEEAPPILPRRAARPAPVRSTFLSFYGLKEQPFGVTPDPAYLYLSEMHRAALRALTCGIENDRGFIALIAPPGMGKTTLLNKLMEDMRDAARVVFLFQTQCDSREFFSYLLRELGEEVAGMDLVAMHARLNALLFQEMLEGRRFVLIVDEAQNLDDSVLETIRLLSDFETTHAKLLEIVLVGQPELAGKLARPGLAQLRQRIGLLASLAPLSVEETARYVAHRLSVAGYAGEPLFTEDALQLIAECSQGTPRRVNNICFNALMAGYLEERRTINAEIVRKVVGGLELESLVPRTPQVEPVAVQAAQAVPEQAQPQPMPQAQFLAQTSNGAARGAKVRPTMLGKISEVVPSGHVGKEREFRLQATLERDASGMPFANRYYCCSFYMGEAEAMAFRVGQRVRVTVEHE